MNILAIDTSNLPLSVAVINEQKVLGELTLNVERNHSIRLMPAVRSLLEGVQLSPKEIDLFVVARGPGSYTGVRIGVTTAKSLAWTVGKPLVGVSSLAALTQQIPFFDGVIVPLFDARRDRFYTAGYEWQGEELVEILSEQILHKDDLVHLLAQDMGQDNGNVPLSHDTGTFPLSWGKTVLFLGDDVVKYRSFFAEALGEKAKFLPAAYQIPRAAHIAHLGYKLYQQGHSESIAFAPTYLQETEAEVNLRR